MSFSDDLLSALPSARACARKLAGRNGDGDDLLHDAVVKALTHSHQFEPETHMAAWLRQIMRNAHYDAGRKAWRTEPLTPGTEMALQAPGDAQERLELVEVLAAIAKLPDGQRPILERVMLGYSLEEAAAYRGCAVATAKNQLLRGRAALRERFG